MGDPAGIGPEVTAKALADRSVRTAARFLVFGAESVFRRAALEAPGLAWRAIGPGDRVRDQDAITLLDTERADEVVYDSFEPRDSALAGALSLRWVAGALHAAGGRPRIQLRKNLRGSGFEWRTPKVDAIVTAPISKASWALAGESRYLGHTELVADACRSARSGRVPAHAMMFFSPELSVVLATAHIPLGAVPREFTTARVAEVIELGHDALRRAGVRSPRLAVCGLNPHAGEGGLLGREDGKIIAPAIVRARKRGVDCQGPFPADTVFAKALSMPGSRSPRRFDGVVAMYHDQGLIPLKLVAFDHAVNATVGLPIIRTSPDHGTAYDIAGTGAADAGSMREAILLAARLCRTGRPARK